MSQPSTSHVKCPGPVLRPSLMKLRPTSATAKLQTHPSLDPGLFNERPKSSIPKTFTSYESPDSINAASQGAVTANILASDDSKKQRRRRPTLEIVENLQPEKMHLDAIDEVNINELLLEKVEERIDLKTMENLKRAFDSADYDMNGKLELHEFKALLKEHLHISSGEEGQIDALFQRIDWSSDGAISWDEFCSYMQLSFEGKEDNLLKGQEIHFNLPAKVENTPHRDTVMRILSTSDGTFVACSTDGTLSFWTSNLELKKTRSIITAEQTQRRQPKWITYFLILNEFNKIVVSSGDHEISFFELSSFEPYCRLISVETVALVMEYAVNPHNPDEVTLFWGDRLGCVNILILSTMGESLRTWKKAPKAEGISTVSFETVLTQPNVKFLRWKVHNDWVLGLKFYPSLRQMVSCSKDEKTALVIGAVLGSTQVDSKATKDSNYSERSGTPTTVASVGGGSTSGQKASPTPQPSTGVLFAGQQQSEGGTPGPGQSPGGQQHYTMSKMTATVLSILQPKTRQAFDQTVFKVYRGVRTFAFHQKRSILVTGGTDRIIRVWNPYVNTKPTGMLAGHNSPVVHLEIDEEDSKLFSMSTDKCVKVWDILDQNCLLTVRPKGHKIRGDFQACHYCSVSKAIMTATDQMSMLNIKQKPIIHSDIPLSHKDPVQCCIYNPHFNQVITASENSTVKVWDVSKGHLVFEFNNAHGDYAVTSLCLDATGRRLITGGRDGALKVWNYNNGNCLREFRKPNKSKTPAEVTAVQFIEMNKNRFFISSGWDRRITTYLDNTTDEVHLVQGPLPPWPNDLLHGHREDVLSLSICPPGFLASSDYSGLVLVWNMVSGHVLCRLLSPLIGGSAGATPSHTVSARSQRSGTKSSKSSHMEQIDVDDDMQRFVASQRRATAAQLTDNLEIDKRVNKVLFLKSRASRRMAAILISSGPQGYVHMWSIYRSGRLLSYFQGSQAPGASIQTMALGNSKGQLENVLFLADKLGYISVWNIQDYAMSQVESDCPELLSRWRAHTQLVTALDTISTKQILVTSSHDCTVRLWTFKGEYVATFGQAREWDLGEPTTFQHPMVPYDVLIDAESLPQPKHPLLTTRKAAIQEEDRRQREKEMREFEEAMAAATALEEGRQMRERSERKQGKDDGLTPSAGRFFKTEGSRVPSAVQQSGSLPALVPSSTVTKPIDVTYGSHQTMTDDEIQELIRSRPYSTGTGKRLRHERVRSAKLLEHGGPQEYHRLPYCDLSPTPPLNEVNVANNRRQEALM